MSFSSFVNIVKSGIDLIAVFFIIYSFITMLSKNMKTMQLFKGVLVIVLLKAITSLLGLSTLDYLVDTILNWGVIAIIVIFQPEIRTILEKIGRTKLDPKNDMSDNEKERVLDELVNAISILSKTNTGALITFERSESLTDYIQKGSKLNAEIKSDLLLSIFYVGTPLHDGAMIIQGNRIVCAAAFYPSTSKDLTNEYGARHRAAIGISEITDSLTVVVSEETGTISFASKGELKKIPLMELKASLVNELNWFKSSEMEDNTNESKK